MDLDLDAPKSKLKNKNKVTKFPVARIKRIMQKDEEVGKVAQATPIVICNSLNPLLPGRPKALELFLALIVEEAHKVTAERGSKKVEAYHLKHAVERTDMLDFLKEIVESVPDPSAGGTVDVDAENGRGEGGKKKRGKAKAKDEEGEGAPKKRRRRKPKQEKEQEEEHAGAGMEAEAEEGVNDEAEYEREKEEPADDGWGDEDKPYMPR
ncbi:histone-fold-containing protein [Gloeophyllum trabeum ATCC 11539]|uniref:Histone-fold-containing protein n=1 Tax=Gloeophyllum trabeum (strain ATCC 11539 / FP-39264 / Madison 617) TaxID=670483 RepID=S7RG75_GLOTA|nr:histone-fold-containing protein [Gloeophyllum trabeum ATCC 11539]EPQ53235.1 histone-fold-containing protein [Gloeophyllum trabeum ATCC 11539]